MSTLDKQYTALAARVSQEEGTQAWQDLAKLGGLRQQLEAAQAALDACVLANSAALTGIVDVIDATGAAVQGPQTVTLWDVSGASAVVSGQAAVTNGAFGLQGPVPAQAALTVQTTGAAGFAVNGYDFRSGPLPAPLPAQPLRCEMVICPEVLVAPAAVQAWASSFQAPTQQIGSAASQTSVAVTFGPVTVALAADTITVTVTGTLTGSLFGQQLNQAPFSAVVPFSLTPSGSPQAGDVVNFAIIGSGLAIKILEPGWGVALVNTLISVAQSPVINLLQSSLGPWVERAVPEFVAGALALPQLPPSTTISLRSLKVDESGIAFQPVLGNVGTGLSTFKPTPLPAS